MVTRSPFSRVVVISVSLFVAVPFVAGQPCRSLAAEAPAAAPAEAKSAPEPAKSKADATAQSKSAAAAKNGKNRAPLKKLPLLNVNTATEAELAGLPGIARASAKRIIAGRPYESVDDLKRAGVPAATIAKLRGLATVSDTAVAYAVAKPESDDESEVLVDLNTATEAQLRAVPEIGSARAKQIIADRPYRSVDDLAKTDLPANEIARIKPKVTVRRQNLAPGKGLVWVNRDSKKYHREGSQWYGNTRNGEYMTEAEAIKAGYVAAKRQYRAAAGERK